MSYYLIYYDNKFAGYTQDQDTLDLFLKQRNKHPLIHIQEMGKKEIPKQVRKIMEDDVWEVEYIHKVILLQSECEPILEILTERLNNFYSACDGIRYLNQFLKLDEEETKHMDIYGNIGKVMVTVIDTIISTGEPEIYNEFIDMTRFVLDILEEEGRRVPYHTS